MRVVITQVLDPASGRVVFRAAGGEAIGEWRGDTGAEVGIFDVEIEIPEVITDWSTPTSRLDGIWSDSVSGSSGLLVQGTVLGLGNGDDDPVVELDVDGSVILVEMSRKSGIAVGDAISFEASSLQLYPRDI